MIADAKTSGESALQLLKGVCSRWKEDSGATADDLFELLDSMPFRLVSNRSASLSGMSYHAASNALAPGDVLSCTLNTYRGYSIMLEDGKGDVVGHVSGKRDIAKRVIRALGSGRTVYAVAADRNVGKSGNRNRVHVLFVEL